MTTRRGLAALVLATTAALSGAGCGGGGGADKAGGSGKPVVLRLANTNGQLDFTPAVDYFARRVGELSGGDLRVESVDGWGDGAADAEQQVVRDVSSGRVDLGWVGTRVFDTLGARSFQALTAPMLIDSYALEEAVIESGITEEMMQGLSELGVAGLGVVPDGLRKPIGVTAPILHRADWRGIAFGTLMSGGQAAAIRALGATPVPVQWEERDERLAAGTLHGFETSLWIHQHNPTLVPLAPYVTINATLWPQMDVLLADPARLEALTDAQRRWLDEAAEDAAARSSALAHRDIQTVRDSCAAGARFARASAADLAALMADFAPVYAALEQHAETKAFIERIQALKQSTLSQPELAVPSGCTGNAPVHAAVTEGEAPGYLNGTYRYVLTQEDADRVGDTDTGYPLVETITLRDGELEGGCFGADGGTYAVADDRITFHSIEGGSYLTVAFDVDGEGSLHLTPVPPMDAGDAFQCFYKPWRRIEGPAATEAAANVDGTYRYVLTPEDARREVPDAGDLDSYPHVETWTLRQGRFTNPGGLSGTYAVDGNRLTFDVPDFGYALAFTFSVDDDGNLHLTPVLPMDAGDRFVWSYKIWRKID